METRDSRYDLIWSVLLLFGSFSIAFNLAIACHELGHALAMVLDRVGIKEFHLNPFSWSWTFPESLNHALFTASGGITFGLMFALLPLIGTIWIRSVYFRIPAFMTAGFAFSINGIYLIAGVFFRIGDGGELLQYGVPRILIVTIGCLYLLISLLILTSIQPVLGIKKSSSFQKRFLIWALGIIPYLLIMFIYNLFLNQKEVWLWFSFALGGVLLVLVVSISGHLWVRVHRALGEINRLEVGWKPVVMILVFGLVIIIGELIVFGIKQNPF